MASKWLDFWAYANWTDVAKRPLYTIMGEIKNACDERQACVEAVHSASFDSDNEWTIDEGDLYGEQGGSPDTQLKMRNALYPKPAVETDSINTGGGTVAVGDIPTSYTLSQLLTTELGYASGTLLNETEELAKMTHVKQWFQVLNYPEYYEVVTIEAGSFGAESEWVEDVETQWIRVVTDYSYEVGTPAFVSASCDVKEPRSTSTPTDVYVTNDLKETAPWSTVTQVRDYTIGEYDTIVATNNWYTAVSDAETFRISAFIAYQLRYDLPDPDQITINVEVFSERIRFKVPDIFRAASPSKFTATLKMYGYYGDPAFSSDPDWAWDDLGTGETEDDVVFVTMTADGSDYYYLEIANPDFTNPTVPSLPTAGNRTDEDYGIQLVTLSIDLASLSTVANAVYLHVNKTDGSAFEYHTPP